MESSDSVNPQPYTAMERVVTCVECGKEQRYRKPAGISGRAPQRCAEHRKNWANLPEERRWQPVS